MGSTQLSPGNLVIPCMMYTRVGVGWHGERRSEGGKEIEEGGSEGGMERKTAYRMDGAALFVTSEAATEDIGYYDYRPVTLLFACFISFQGYDLS